MKAIQNIKKMVALGVGLTMLGATIMGASAKLGGYPDPFVVKGVPASNLAVVVGDDAKGSDTLGAVDIIAAMQASAVTKSAVAGGTSKVQFAGESVQIGKPTQLLELDEPLGDVTPTLEDADLPNLLKGGTITTQQGVTKYTENLVLNSTGNTGNVTFLRTDDGTVGTFLTYTDGAEAYAYKMVFEEGLVSDTSSTNDTQATLPDVEQRDLHMLGNIYTIVDVVTDTKSTSSTRDIKFTLMGGQIRETLGEGDKKTYTLSTAAGASKEYEVEVILISETDKEVILKVNGKQLPRMKIGDSEALPDGTLIGVATIDVTGKDTQTSRVGMVLGANKIFLHDTDYLDSVATSSGLTINNEDIEDSRVTIKGSLNSDRTELTLSDLKIQLFVDPAAGRQAAYIAPGHGLREYLDEPEGMITPHWDIKYEGLMDTGVTTLKIEPYGQTEYHMTGTWQDGTTTTVPLVNVVSSALYPGRTVQGVRRNTMLAEALDSNGAARQVSARPNDIFSVCDIVGNWTSLSSNGAYMAYAPETHTDKTGYAHFLKYESIDTTNQVLTFTDLATGTKQVTYSSISNQWTADLVVAGTTYKVVVLNGSANPAANAELMIDMNGDGLFTGHAEIDALAGGRLIAFAPEAMGIPNASAAVPANRMYMSLTQLASDYDERTTHARTFIAISLLGDHVYVNKSGFVGNDTIGTAISSYQESQTYQFVDQYGAMHQFYDPSPTDQASTYIGEMPLAQRGAMVFVTSGAVTRQEIEGSTTEKVNPISVGVSKLASEVVSNLDSFNAIVVGGPCANPAAASLLGNPADCAEGFTPGKALIKLFQHTNGNVALLVAGYSAEDTRRAAKAVATGQLASIESNQAEVVGTSLQDFSVKAVV